MEGVWTLESQAGSGGFGVVSVWSHSVTGRKLAVKKCRRDLRSSASQREKWINEVQIMGQLKHPNVIESFLPPEDFGVTDDGSSHSLPLLFMEFCSGGDLRGILNEPENCCGLPETEVLTITNHLASALGFLHNRRVLHRDLKPENIVVSTESGRPVYKLIDLGYAKKLDQGSLAQTIVGTLQYLAPEFFMGQTYSKSVDYWSLGLIVHEIITGFRPFLPDQPPGKWMQAIEEKKPGTICIPNVGDERSKLYDENRISVSYQKEITSWLQTLLEYNPILRGKDAFDNIVVFSKLEKMFNAKRVKIFFLDKYYDRIDFVLKPGDTISDVSRYVQGISGIPSSNQIILSTNSIRLLDSEDVPNCIYVSDLRPASVSEKIQNYGLSVPISVRAALKSTKTEFDFNSRKRTYYHGFYFLQRESENARNRAIGVKSLFGYILNTLKVLTSEKEVISEAITSLKAKYELFEESLLFDIEKYLSQKRVVSSTIFDSWTDTELTTGMSNIDTDMVQCNKSFEFFNQKILKHKKTSFLVDTFNSELISKYKKILEKFRSSSSEKSFRTSKGSVVEVARIVVECLKNRDESLRIHFQNLSSLSSLVKSMDETNLLVSKVKNQAEFLKKLVSDSLKRRQSDIWSLLIEVDENKKSTVDNNASFVVQNEALRARFTETVDKTIDSVRNYMQNME